MIRLLMLAADAPSVLHDAISNGNVWLAVAAGVVVLVPIVLHAMGKDIPFLSPILDALLDMAVKALDKKPPAPPASPDSPAPKEGLANVVDIKKDK